MPKIHADIKVNGIVQGVGFRPFVHKVISDDELYGFVRNTSDGAQICVEGEERAIDTLITTLKNGGPRLSFIESVEVEKSDNLCGYLRFEIIESEGGDARRTLISPDIAVCDDCLRELFDKNDRRYKYPFINCTNCGPRFTIIKDIPYDRANTTMSQFEMCSACEGEYSDIENRRYHAQPDCCSTCGPRLYFYDTSGEQVSGDAIENAKKYLRDGKIVAIKGLGGIHLACRCDDAKTVETLRLRKRRDEKPFAIMCRNIEVAEKYAKISQDEKSFLTSHRRPIVLLNKKEKCAFSHISENGYIGIMLPYTPMHYLLLTDDIESVVMTSANIADLPIIYKDAAARRELSRVADGFLLNDREIHTRCDDSLMWVHNGHEYFARRSRGYVPQPINAGEELDAILACGAEQKASFALARGNNIFISQHIGDLKNLETLQNYEAQIKHFENIFDIKPKMVVCDLHPDYMSTEYAESRGLPLCRVQHHHAHMASCMADNRFDGDCIGIVWDGTGYGEDGEIWGAEFLTGNYEKIMRCGTIYPIKLPGGDRATREISRIGASLCHDAGVSIDQSVAQIINTGINCPKATSMGRLFDGICAILEIKNTASYEGQGAVLLEACADENCTRAYPYKILDSDGVYVFDWREMVREIIKDKENHVNKGEIAASFMNTLISFAAEMAKKISDDTGIKTVALSGGTFQNMYILKRLESELSKLGLCVLTHCRVATNDEGISLGQIMIAQRGGGKNVSCGTT